MQQYPVGGPRQPVYDLMRGLGFSMVKFSDKTWTSADGLEVQIYGAGSMARLTVADTPQGEYSLDDLPEQIDGIRRHFNRPA